MITAPPVTGVGELVTVAHGTRDGSGNRVAHRLTTRASARLGVPGRTTFVELQAPLVHDVMADRPSELASDAPRVVVPLLLSTGHHARTDLPAAVARAVDDVLLAAPLGPDPLLARAQMARLVSVGAVPGQPVLMVAAGSRDPAAVHDVEAVAGLLASAWGGEVRVAALAGPLPRPHQVVRGGDVVSPYLLAEGHFARRMRAEVAPGTPVAPVLGAHDAIVDLVVQRTLETVAARGASPRQQRRAS